jgi:hypothetical protein
MLLREARSLRLSMVRYLDDDGAPARYQLGRKLRRMADIRAALRRKAAWCRAQVERVEREDGLMVNGEASGGPGMVLIAGVSFCSPEIAAAIGRTDGRVPRGAEVPIGALGLVRNGEVMLRAGMLKWSPPSVPRPVVAPVAPAAGKPAAPVVDPVTELRREMRRHVAAGADWSTAEDRVLSTQRGCELYERAQRAFALMDRAANRRRTDGFRQFLMQQQEAAP